MDEGGCTRSPQKSCLQTSYRTYRRCNTQILKEIVVNMKEADEEVLVVSTKEIKKIGGIWEDFEEDANVIDGHEKTQRQRLSVK